MQVWNVLHTARWKYRTQKIAENSPSAHHRTNSLGYIFATKAGIDNWKNLLNSKIFPVCSRNILNFGPLTAEIGSLVCRTPANFNGFRVFTLRSVRVCQLLCTAPLETFQTQVLTNNPGHRRPMNTRGISRTVLWVSCLSSSLGTKSLTVSTFSSVRVQTDGKSK